VFSGGLAAATVATVAGVIALDRKSTLDDVCNPECPREHAEDINSYREARAVSYIGYGISVVAVGVGLWLWLGAEDEPQRARVEPWLGPRQGGLRGTF
jgi:hypothetical protein